MILYLEVGGLAEQGLWTTQFLKVFKRSCKVKCFFVMVFMSLERERKKEETYVVEGT